MLLRMHAFVLLTGHQLLALTHYLTVIRCEESEYYPTIGH